MQSSWCKKINVKRCSWKSEDRNTEELKQGVLHFSLILAHMKTDQLWVHIIVNMQLVTGVWSFQSVRPVKIISSTSAACLAARRHSAQSFLSKAHYSKVTAFILRMKGPSREETTSPQQCGFHLYPQRQTLPFIPALHCVFTFYQLLVCSTVSVEAKDESLVGKPHLENPDGTIWCNHCMSKHT